MTDLKPCPFCGGEELRFKTEDIDGWIAFVECISCDDMVGPMSANKHDDMADAEEDAAKVWNTRAPDPRVQALVDALRPFASKADARRKKNLVGAECFLQPDLIAARAALKQWEDGE